MLRVLDEIFGSQSVAYGTQSNARVVAVRRGMAERVETMMIRVLLNVRVVDLQ
jgi:hypothetical protein